MRHSFGGDRVHERLNNVRLSDHIVKCAGSIFSRRDLVVHLISKLSSCVQVLRLQHQNYQSEETDAMCLATYRMKWGQVILRHTELAAYRCFLPDLAGFTGFYCTGPSPCSRT